MKSFGFFDVQKKLRVKQSSAGINNSMSHQQFFWREIRQAVCKPC
jgi:hypothetical protein